MSTRCLIGIMNHDTQTIQANYCHFDGYPSNMLPKLKALTPGAIQALTQGNSIVSLKKQPPERTDEADLHTLDMTQSPLSLPFWCSYVYAYNPNTKGWTVYNAHGNVIQSDDLPND